MDSSSLIALMGLALLALLLALATIVRARVARRRLLQSNEALSHMINVDLLTGAFNHHGLMEAGQAAYQASVDKGQQISLIMLDLDNFKAINDSIGHLAGDEALKTVSALIRRAAKETEIVARYGGDEFAVVLVNSGPGRPNEITEVIRASLMSIRLPDGRPLTACMGVAIVEQSTPTFQELIQKADFALLRAKAFGTDRIVFSYDGKFIGHTSTNGARPSIVLPFQATSGSDYRIYSGAPKLHQPVILPHQVRQVLNSIFADPRERQRMEEVIEDLIRTLKVKDPTTAQHIVRCGIYAALVGEKLGLGEEHIAHIQMAGMIHDLGKIATPDTILKKSEPLSAEEWQIMREHPAMSIALLPDVEPMHLVRQIVRHHHEHFDGGGYPDGLKGGQIPLGSRVLLVTDAFDAMTHDRPYRRALPLERAIAELVRFRGQQFDPDSVDAFMEAILYSAAPLEILTGDHAK